MNDRRFTDILIGIGRAAEADRQADDLLEAHFYGKATAMEVALALSKAHLELKEAMSAIGRRVVELEQAAQNMDERHAA